MVDFEADTRIGSCGPSTQATPELVTAENQVSELSR